MNFPTYCCSCFFRGSKYLLNKSCLLKLKPSSSEIKAMAGSLKFIDQHRKDSMNAVNIQYEEAVQALNALQSNALVLEKISKQKRISNNRIETQKYLERVGISLSELDKLPIIHLAGTKGKGSTGAFVESILKEHGYKTGFYSSPHLVVVTERIRVNGLPITKREFSHYFWDVYETLSACKTEQSDMPAYFKFLTVLALKIFLKEEVDVAIIEVGIGGEHDCTNVIRRPVVCGITSLELDHTAYLGDTIEEIAWQKAGIMKPQVLTFTVPEQKPEAFQVLSARAEEKQSKLYVAPPLESYDWGGRTIHLGLNGYVQFTNASLALQLSHYFMKNRRLKRENSTEICDNNLWGKPFVLSDEDIFALENVLWIGRSQVLVKDTTTFFLDGAHTASSIQNCIDWYDKESSLHIPTESVKDVYKVLMFNLTGDRDYEPLLAKLFPCNFDLAIFSTNLATKDLKPSSDQCNFTVTEATQMARCQKMSKYWLKLVEKHQHLGGSNGGMNSEDIPQRCSTFHCVRDALLWISCGNSSYVQGEMTQPTDFPQPNRLRDASHVQVLVTGSLHLVGAALVILDPSLSHLSRNPEVSHGCSSMADLVKRKYVHSQYSSPGAP